MVFILETILGAPQIENPGVETGANSSRKSSLTG
jgi:hypothetical protein